MAIASHDEGIQIYGPTQCWKMIVKANTLLYFLEAIQYVKAW